MKNNTTKVLGSQELRERMPRGGIGRIAKKYGVSWVWAYNVISGKVAGNPSIIEDAQAMASIEDETREKLSAVI